MLETVMAKKGKKEEASKEKRKQERESKTSAEGLVVRCCFLNLS